jgi:RNA polymerase sigma-70 factor (ECF subfamily)
MGDDTDLAMADRNGRGTDGVRAMPGDATIAPSPPLPVPATTPLEPRFLSCDKHPSGREALAPHTQATLLVRLYKSGTPDGDAWKEFVDLYGRAIYRWCRCWQLQDADAEELTQQVLLQLLAKMKAFVYDPARSFRAWLKTVTHNAWRNMVASRQYRMAGNGDSRLWDQLLAVPARDDLVERLERAFDHELLQAAMIRVRLRVAAHNWEAFKLTALDGVPAPEAARRLDMKIANLYAARSSIQRMLREELKKLESNEQ